MQAKSQSLQRHIVKLEDDVLEAMMVREEADESAKAATTALETITQQRANLISDLQAESDKLRNLGQTLITEASELKPEIPAGPQYPR